MRVLNFHLPNDTGPVELRQSPVLRFRQLVCWCLIQRYRYYVLNDPKVSDLQYDQIEAECTQLAKEFGLKNPYAPHKRPGSTRKADYPGSVRRWFAGHKKRKR